MDGSGHGDQHQPMRGGYKPVPVGLQVWVEEQTLVLDKGQETQVDQVGALDLLHLLVAHAVDRRRVLERQPFNKPVCINQEI